MKQHCSVLHAAMNFQQCFWISNMERSTYITIHAMYRMSICWIIIPHRLSYAVCLIDDLIKRHEHTEVYIMYDVACTLQKHLKVSKGHNLIPYLSNNTLATHLCLEKHSAKSWKTVIVTSIVYNISTALWKKWSYRKTPPLRSNLSVIWPQGSMPGMLV